MTDLLKRIESGLDACGITPGPWKLDYGGTKGHIKAIINIGERATPTVALYSSGIGAQSLPTEEYGESEHNGRVIAQSRNSIKQNIRLALVLENYGFIGQALADTIETIQNAIGIQWEEVQKRLNDE